LIEKGFDEDKRMNYYKVYFREEQWFLRLLRDFTDLFRFYRFTV
jgi:hypothetical protein